MRDFIREQSRLWLEFVYWKEKGMIRVERVCVRRGKVGEEEKKESFLKK